MENQVKFIEALYANFIKNIKKHIENKKKHSSWANLMDKNCGKTALKRKITLLRQELLNLEKMLDESDV